jgi:hypothetical protein
VAYDKLFQKPYSRFFSGFEIPSFFPEGDKGILIYILWLFYQIVFLVVLYYFSFRIFYLIFRIKKSEKEILPTPKHNYYIISEIILIILMGVPLCHVFLIFSSHLIPHLGLVEYMLIGSFGLPISLFLSWRVVKLVFKNKTQ